MYLNLNRLPDRYYVARMLMDLAEDQTNSNHLGLEKTTFLKSCFKRNSLCISADRGSCRSVSKCCLFRYKELLVSLLPLPLVNKHISLRLARQDE